SLASLFCGLPCVGLVSGKPARSATSGGPSHASYLLRRTANDDAIPGGPAVPSPNFVSHGWPFTPSFAFNIYSGLARKATHLGSGKYFPTIVHRVPASGTCTCLAKFTTGLNKERLQLLMVLVTTGFLRSCVYVKGECL